MGPNPVLLTYKLKLNYCYLWEFDKLITICCSVTYLQCVCYRQKVKFKSQGKDKIYGSLLFWLCDRVASLGLISSTNMRKANLSICILKF